ncbi:MAG: hypothetical protein M0R33_13670 [Methylomonas sp.]|nr:hypothetical protein [Methylomonas sp.]MCK9607484.1 hypothetical protein [Methylomonas sp.]
MITQATDFLVQSDEQRGGQGKLFAFHCSEGTFQRLTRGFDLREFHRAGGALQAVRFAEDRLDDFGLRDFVRGFLEFGDAGKQGVEMFLRLGHEGGEESLEEGMICVGHRVSP